MLTPQTVLGIAIAALSVAGIVYGRRVLVLSHVLRRMTERRGEPRALTIVRVFFSAGAIFGACLALRIVNPIQW